MKCGSHRLNILSFPALSCQRQFPAGVGEAEHLIQCTVIPKGDRWLAAQQTQQDTITYRSALILRFGVPEYDSQKREAWVQRVTGPLVDGDLRVTEAEHEHREARDALIGRPEQAQMARLAAYARVFGTNNVLHNRQSYLSANPAQQGGARAAQAAKQVREKAKLLTNLTPAEATAQIDQTRAAQAAREL